MNKRVHDCLAVMKTMFPDAHVQLNFRSAYELTCAVMLSAQTTDIAVNKVTPALFSKYPTVVDLAQADVDEVEGLIMTIGLYKNKARALIAMAQKVVTVYDGQIPHTQKALLSLAGVGVKTANVIRSVWFELPAIAVDTHVERVSKRLGFAKFSDNVHAVEKKLKRKIKRCDWSSSHHLMIFFGRFHCKAVAPLCKTCPLQAQCLYFRKSSHNSQTLLK